MVSSDSASAPWATAALVLGDRSVCWGYGLGVKGCTVGEICFNTAMTGYQEILTDPSYAGQIITFTFPHIGNVGANAEDIESTAPVARGLVLRDDVTQPSNFRARQHLDRWLTAGNMMGITGVDTRRLTRLIRDGGFQSAAISHGTIDLDVAHDAVAGFPGLEGIDLAKDVTCRQTYSWSETLWRLGEGYGAFGTPAHKVAAVDYGIKHNILRHLAERGCDVTVVPASASTDDIMRHEPDGIFLSNGPGDPAATGVYAVPVIQELIETGKPVFGICLGHQMLALALGAKTVKMFNGHRGANHPIKNLETGAVEITSQNHGFVVDKESLPDGVACTHVSLFDGTLAGLKMTDKPVFSVQYHPEASPGPQDSRYLFDRFIDAMEAAP